MTQPSQDVSHMLRDWRNGDQQALERDSHERDAFLAQAGEGDDTLHSEVTQLLDGHANANSFIETPAHEVAADIFAAQLVGQQLNHYKILALLGQKGMGEVCQAPDTKLDRVVALKILPADLALNAERMRRIVREAKAASALNHPHVATIHEIGEASTEMGTLPNKLTRHFIGQALC